MCMFITLFDTQSKLKIINTHHNRIAINRRLLLPLATAIRENSTGDNLVNFFRHVIGQSWSHYVVNEISHLFDYNRRDRLVTVDQILVVDQSEY